LQQAFPKCQQFDIVAFSLGARIALTTIASFPTLIRKAHLTGVGLERNSFAKIVIQSWKEILFKSAGMYGWNDDGGGDGDHIIHERNLVESTALTSFAWSIIMTTYSKEFLTKNGSEKISSWVDHICQNNNVVGLTKLLEQTHDNNEDDRMISIVQQIKRKKSSTQGKIHIGEIDEISTVAQAEGLNELLGWETTNGVTIYENCGHAVMNENGRQWRKNMLDYLNA
jgi:pimeloyl-ACP methyl ester carboxylesterase